MRIFPKSSPAPLSLSEWQPPPTTGSIAFTAHQSDIGSYEVWFDIDDIRVIIKEAAAAASEPIRMAAREECRLASLLALPLADSITHLLADETAEALCLLGAASEAEIEVLRQRLRDAKRSRH